jgi:hypothetical protein
VKIPAGIIPHFRWIFIISDQRQSGIRSLESDIPPQIIEKKIMDRIYRIEKARGLTGFRIQNIQILKILLHLINPVNPVYQRFFPARL